MGLFVFGFPNSSGVLLDAYLADAQYVSQERAATLLPLIGTFNMGILYCGGTSASAGNSPRPADLRL